MLRSWMAVFTSLLERAIVRACEGEEMGAQASEMEVVTFSTVWLIEERVEAGTPRFWRPSVAHLNIVGGVV